jgi:glucokinase
MASLFGGIDLGGTKIQAVIVDDDHKVLGSARRPTPTSGGPADVAAEVETALRDAAKAAEIEPSALAGVGVGSPGVIEQGSVTSARNLPG